MNRDAVPSTEISADGVLHPNIDRGAAAKKNATRVQVFRAGGHSTTSKTKTYRPLKTVRLDCLECSGSSPKSVLWCPADGVHSTRCHLWPYRFGVMPKTLAQRHGPALVTPGMMPDANMNEDDVPNGVQAATAYLLEKCAE